MKLSRKTHSAFLIVTTLIIASNLLFFIFAETFSFNFATNSRPEFFLSHYSNEQNRFYEPFSGFLISLEDCLQNSRCSISTLSSPDDIGNAIIFWLGNKITPVYQKSTPDEYVTTFRDPSTHPLATRIFYILFHFIILALFSYIGFHTLGPLNTALTGISICIFHSIFYLTYSYDVYLFPLYAALISIFLLKHNTFSYVSIIVFALFAGICTWFRATSLIIAIGTSLIAILLILKNNTPLVAKKIILFIMLVFFIAKAPSFFLKSSTHVFWHTLHAGLFDQGSHENIKGRLIPNFLLHTTEIKPHGLRYLRWNDQIQYNLVKDIAPAASLYSKEYEDVLKHDFLNLISLDWFATCQFYLSRIPWSYSLNPFKDVLYNGYYTPLNLDSPLKTYLYFSVFIIFFICFIKLNKASPLKLVVLISLLIFTAIPSVLVSSMHMNYSVATLLIQWIIVFDVIAFYTTKLILQYRDSNTSNAKSIL